MKSAKNVKIKKNSITIKRLKKGKTYYVRVRAFSKDSNGKQICTAWSTAKKVTIKKLQISFHHSYINTKYPTDFSVGYSASEINYLKQARGILESYTMPVETRNRISITTGTA